MGPTDSKIYLIIPVQCTGINQNFFHEINIISCHRFWFLLV